MQDHVSCTGSSSRLPHSSASQPSVPFLSLVPGRGLFGSNTVLGGLPGVCNIHITFLSYKPKCLVHIYKTEHQTYKYMNGMCFQNKVRQDHILLGCNALTKIGMPNSRNQYTVYKKGLSRKHPAILNILRTGHMALL
jgi:hypothetical protein